MCCIILFSPFTAPCSYKFIGLQMNLQEVHEFVTATLICYLISLLCSVFFFIFNFVEDKKKMFEDKKMLKIKKMFKSSFVFVTLLTPVLLLYKNIFCFHTPIIQEKLATVSFYYSLLFPICVKFLPPCCPLQLLSHIPNIKE